MRSEEQEQAFHPQSNDYPYGNNVLYLSKMTLELIHSNLTLKSTQQDGTTLSFTVVTMPVLVVNLSMDLAQNNILNNIDRGIIGTNQLQFQGLNDSNHSIASINQLLYAQQSL